MPEGNKLNDSIVTENKLWEWLVAFIVYIGLFVLMLEYHRWRSRPYSVFTANKAVAISMSLLFSFSLGLGPLRRLTGRFRKAIRLRRSLGGDGCDFYGFACDLITFFCGAGSYA